MILNAAGLSFRYNSHPVIEDASFSVEEGEILSILGPNGAGKTTLLKCLNRLLTPRQGTVTIDGSDIHRMRKRQLARKIGWVSQHAEPNRIRVYDLILLGRKPWFQWAPAKQDHILVEAAIRLLDIEVLSMRYADEISGGELQMVRIAQALARNPRLILFDEPTSSLDISHQHLLMSTISRLIHSGPISAVMTMHDINLALRYSDKFLLLKDGCICSAGNRDVITPENIRQVYDIETAVTEACGYPVVIPL